MMLRTVFKQFITCHEGALNRLLHIVGIALIGIGILQKSVGLVIAGGLVQEAGHFYQYAKTKNPAHSPWFCTKPQLFFAYPLFVVIILYVLLAQ